MKAFGIPAARLALYAVVLAVLVGVNVWRLWSPDEDGRAPRDDRTVSALAELPDIEAGRSLTGFSTAEPARDIFRNVEPAAPPPPPPPPREPPPPIDETVQAVADARRIFSQITLRGLLGGADGMTAVVEYDNAIKSVGVGDEVIPGYRVNAISIDELAIRHVELGITETYRLD